MWETLKAAIPFKITPKRVVVFYCLAKLTLTLLFFGSAYLLS